MMSLRYGRVKAITATFFACFPTQIHESAHLVRNSNFRAKFYAQSEYDIRFMRKMKIADVTWVTSRVFPADDWAPPMEFPARYHAD